MGRIVNILLIEDNEDDALFFRVGLRGTSARIAHVLHAQEAIAKLETRPLPDLIVADLNLPGLSLNSFLDWIRTNPTVQQIPIVIYTGCLSVPAAITAVVRKSFFKSGDLDQTRLTVLEILGFAAREQI